ncbi:MAG: membrane protein insertion efficiency factor YidD [Clostridia bacterium]|nr:membrane protein insertion efficiency factor YidD [Clostridia bacterium]
MEKDVAYFRREYKRQKKLEQIVNARVLKRPNVKKWQVTAMFVILPFLLLSAILLSVFVRLAVVYKVLIAVISVVLIFETYVRFCLILTVKCYQRYAADKTRRRCKCIPSCSEYALLALRKCYPLLAAVLKIRKRLYKTCNGEEYKVDFPTQKENKKYENVL